MTLGEALREATETLAAHGVESAAVDAQWLAASVVGLSATRLYVERERRLTPPQAARLRELVARRAAREPLAYVLGEWGFRRLTLKTDPRALVPRPETEVTVERCLAFLAGHRAPAVLDVGTGSGAIALALLDEHPGARVTAVDRSADALALAAENARRTGLADRLTLVRADLVEGLPGTGYDLVVANPPYVLADELAALEPEVARWEPPEALVDRGQTEAVSRAALALLRPGGRLVLEVHAHGARRVASSLVEMGYRDVHVERDLAVRERVVEGSAP